MENIGLWAANNAINTKKKTKLVRYESEVSNKPDLKTYLKTSSSQAAVGFLSSCMCYFHGEPFSPADFFCRSQVIALPIQKVSQTLLKANLGPKNVCLVLIRPKVSF